MKNNPIDEALGLKPIEELQSTEVEIFEEKSTEIIPVSDDPGENETLKDLETVRKNIENIIKLGGDSLQEMIDLAKQSESPRAFEVASTLMKTLLDANKDFVDISMKKKYHKEELESEPNSSKNQTNITNNNLILSTSDLLNMLKGDKNDK